VERYARQAAIQGWDQQRLADATVGIAGSGPVAFLCGLMAAAIGFGRLVLIGGMEKMGGKARGLERLMRSPVVRWADFFRRINPAVEFIPIPYSLSAKLLPRLPEMDVLIAAGNDYAALEQVASISSIPTVAGCAAEPLGFWGVARANGMIARLCRFPESGLVGQIVAGLLVDEARKALLPLAEESGRATEMCALVLPRLPGWREPDRPRALRLPFGSLSVVGAGALGTWFGMALGLIDFRGDVHLYDADVVDETNLNRQVLFSGAVGRPKAPVLAGRLQRLFPHMRVNGYGALVDESTERYVSGCDALAACPDNFAVRAFLNRTARKRKRILLSGGTSAMGGSCATYVPGHTPCLNCLMDIDGLAKRETQAQGCAQVAQASVVTSNAITGALMAWCVREMGAGRVRGGIWEYDGRARDERLGVHSLREGCKCHLRGWTV
jgi:molybdopterin/thiamine biosynthesis adenylyltransferase